MMLMIAFSIILGAGWRRLKGANGYGALTTWAFPAVCAVPLVPLWGQLDPGKWMLALAAASAAFLLVFHHA